jgi:hypothetical protein
MEGSLYQKRLYQKRRLVQNARTAEPSVKLLALASAEQSTGRRQKAFRLSDRVPIAVALQSEESLTEISAG